MKKLNEWLYRRSLKKIDKRPAGFPHWGDVHSIILLYDSDIMEKNPTIKKIVAELQNEGKEVITLGYVQRKDVSSAILPQSRMLGQKDFNWFRMPKTDVQHDIEKRKYDLMLDLTLTPIIELQYMAMYVRADFKAGRQMGEGVNNLMIDLPVDAGREDLFRELVKYLKIIESRD